MTGTEEVIVSVSTWLPVPYWLAALMVTGNTPLRIGGPVMTPVTGSRFTPAGSPMLLKETGLLLAVIV